MHELPANHMPVVIIGDLGQLKVAELFLESKGYQIQQQIISNAEFWRSATEDERTESGCHSTALWQANPLLTEVIDCIESNTHGRTMVDLACGAGRDSVYLATRGWQVTSIDNKSNALERCEQLANSMDVSLTTLLKDLENQTHPLEELSADLVLVMRYLHRPLFPEIDQLINPEGILVYSTFMIGSEKFGSPRNPNYLLTPGELAEVFSSYQILKDEQRELPDGRPVALFVAKKVVAN